MEHSCHNEVDWDKIAVPVEINDNITVSEHDRVDEIGFSSWHSSLTWICKQAKRISEYEVQGSEYIVDSGHYRYRIYFPRNQE